jgi:hypothetical protein
MSKPSKSGAGPQAAVVEAAETQAAVDAGVRAEVFGVEFRVDAGDILASREYADRVVVVTRDGRKLTQPKRGAK